MPNSVSPSVNGARAAKELLLRVERLIREASANGEDTDIAQAHALFVDALADHRARRGIQLALVQFVVAAMEGNVLDVRTWTPLAQSDPHEAPPPQVRRF